MSKCCTIVSYIYFYTLYWYNDIKIAKVRLWSTYNNAYLSTIQLRPRTTNTQIILLSTPHRHRVLSPPPCIPSWSQTSSDTRFYHVDLNHDNDDNNDNKSSTSTAESFESTLCELYNDVLFHAIIPEEDEYYFSCARVVVIKPPNIPLF